jgi:hypothetical protein
MTLHLHGAHPLARRANPADSAKRRGRPPPKTAQPGESESPVTRVDRFGVIGRHPSATPPASAPISDEVLPLLLAHHQSW